MPTSPAFVEIVQASPANVSEAAPLFDAYRRFYRKPPDLAGAHRFLFARLTKRESVFFLARVDGEAAGFVHLYPVFSSLSMQPQWILSDLFVAPGQRRAGVGRALMERARELAESTQADALLLETASDNQTAQSLYASLGYKRDEEFFRYALRVDSRDGQ